MSGITDTLHGATDVSFRDGLNNLPYLVHAYPSLSPFVPPTQPLPVALSVPSPFLLSRYRPPGGTSPLLHSSLPVPPSLRLPPAPFPTPLPASYLTSPIFASSSVTPCLLASITCVLLQQQRARDAQTPAFLVNPISQARKRQKPQIQCHLLPLQKAQVGAASLTCDVVLLTCLARLALSVCLTTSIRIPPSL